MTKEFRVWCKTRQEYEKDEVLIDQKGRLIQHGKHIFMYLKPDNHIIEWFTGILDKNGDKIFEGDKCRIWIEGIKQKQLYTVRSTEELYFEMNREDSYYRITAIEIVRTVHDKKGDK